MTNHNDPVLIKNDIKSISVYLIRVFKWEEGYQSVALVSLLIWTFTCYHTQLVIYSLPIWITLSFIYPIQFNETTATEVLKEELALALPSLDYFNDTCQQWHQSWIQFTAHQKITSFVSFFGLWMLTFYTLGTRSLVWSVGTLVLAWHSRGLQVIRVSYHRATLIAMHAKQKLQSISIPTKQSQQLDRCYLFKVIEHQRWWFHKGWIPVLLPHDRPKWSDEYLFEAPSIHEFQLPPATTRLGSLVTWEWMTDDWQIDTTSNVDTEGWEYGDWDWTQWSSVSKGPRKLTRRRQWIRQARLVQPSQPIAIPRSSSSTTSCSLSTSASSFEDEQDSLCTTPTSLNTFSSQKQPSVEHHFWLRR